MLTAAILSSLLIIPPQNRVPLFEYQTVLRVFEGKQEVYLRQIVVWDLYHTPRGVELHVVDWVRLEDCSLRKVGGKWLLSIKRFDKYVHAVADRLIETEGYVDVELLDRQAFNVYERRGLQ